MRRLACRWFPLLAGLVVAFALPRGAAAEAPPNFVFIFADDQCYETVAALGHPTIETPNLDRLVRRGMTFTHTYNSGSWTAAVCIASRTMLVTGRQLWHAHQIGGKCEQEREEGRFWPVYLRRAGYDTYFTGKWHVAANAQKAFDFVRNVRPGMPNQTPEGYHRPPAEGPDPWSPWDPRFGGFWSGGTHWSEVLAEDAAAFFEQAAARENPFFMYLAFNAPHDPRQSPREYVEKYPLEEVDVPASFLPEYPYKGAIGCSPSLRDEKLAPFPRTRHAVKVHRQEYYAIITHMDAQIGRMLAALERTGKADRTYIFFTADHGLAVGHHGLMGKQNLYDHSVRVPMIVVGPGVPENRRCDAPIYLQDIMPTTLELAGVEIPEHVDFRSLVPLFHGESSKPYDAIYGAYLDVQRSVTWEGYKLILYPRVPKARLYHLADDPLELRDLAGDAEQLPRMQRLFSRLVALQQEFADPLDLAANFPELGARPAAGD